MNDKCQPVRGEDMESKKDVAEHSAAPPCSPKRCVYDTDGDGDCMYCARRGGCKNMGGPYESRSKYPPGTPDSAVRGFEPK